MPDKLDRGAAPDGLAGGGAADRLDLTAIERKVEGERYADGLWDITAGLGMVGVSIIWAYHLSVWLILVVSLIWLLPDYAHRKISIPRIGFAEPSKAQSARDLYLWRAMVLVALILMLALVALPYDLWRWVEHRVSPEGFICVAFAIVFVIRAATERVLRWYGYAALVLAGMGVAWLLDINRLWSLPSAGVLIVLSGSVVLSGFIRRHPVLKEEAGDNPLSGCEQ